MSLQIKSLSAVDVMWMWILVLDFLFPMVLQASTGTVSFVTVRTRAPSNPNPRIWYRVPSDYRVVPGRTWRTLVIFGGRNCGGSNEVSNTIGWAKWADDHGVFHAPSARMRNAPGLVTCGDADTARDILSPTCPQRALPIS